MSRWLPHKLRINILVVDIFIWRLSRMRALPVLSTFYVRNIHNVLNWLSRRFTGSCALNIIDHHLISNKLVRFRLNILKWLQCVSGIQRIRWGVAASRLKLIHAGSTAFYVCVSQIVLWLVEFEMEHPWTSSLHVECVVEVRPIDLLGGPYFWLGS